MGTVEQLAGDPQPPTQALVIGAKPQPQPAVELLGELERMLAPTSAGRGQLQVLLAGVVGRLSSIERFGLRILC